MVDEMDLVGQLKAAAPLRPQAYERARATLGAAMVQAPATTPARGRRLSLVGSRRRTFGTAGKVGIGAGIGAAAAAVAIVLVATSAPRTAAPGGSPTGASAGSTGLAAQTPAAGSPLVTLAADIKATGSSVPGDASLAIVDQVIGGKLMQVYYGLYTDGGALYSGDDKKTLVSAVNHHANQADSVDTREVAAARYAATGNLTTARELMVNATPNWYALGQSAAARNAAWQKGAAQASKILKEKGVKTPLKEPTGKALQADIDDSVWDNSIDSLTWGAANPQIRAGVLRLLSTLPEVTVAKSTTGGQPTLTLTAGAALLDGGKQVLTINAKTGMPISSVVTLPQVATSVETYQVSRVTLAAVKSGKF
ncbi:MAG TPA: hypothetical protein VGG54_34865 [Trebonia sp.]